MLLIFLQLADEKVVKVLKPFEEATVAVSSEGSSAALTIPVVNSSYIS